MRWTVLCMVLLGCGSTIATRPPESDAGDMTDTAAPDATPAADAETVLDSAQMSAVDITASPDVAAECVETGDGHSCDFRDTTCASNDSNCHVCIAGECVHCGWRNEPCCHHLRPPRCNSSTDECRFNGSGEGFPRCLAIE